MDQSQGNAFNFQLNARLVGRTRIFFKQATVHEIVNWDDVGGGDKGLSVLYVFACFFISLRLLRIIETITKVVNHLSVASSIIVSF